MTTSIIGSILHWARSAQDKQIYCRDCRGWNEKLHFLSKKPNLCSWSIKAHAVIGSRRMNIDWESQYLALVQKWWHYHHDHHHQNLQILNGRVCNSATPHHHNRIMNIRVNIAISNVTTIITIVTAVITVNTSALSASSSLLAKGRQYHGGAGCEYCN